MDLHAHIVIVTRYIYLIYNIIQINDRFLGLLFPPKNSYMSVKI